MLHHYLRGSSLAVMNDAANRMGSLVAGEPGATPVISTEEIRKVQSSRSFALERDDAD